MYDSLTRGKWWHCLPFLFAPVYLANAQPGMVNLGNVGVGTVIGTIAFQVEINVQEVDLQVVATDLYKDGSLRPGAYKIPVASTGAMITCEDGHRLPAGNPSLLAWQSVAPPDPLAGWTGAVGETGTFAGITGGTFSQPVSVTVQWDQNKLVQMGPPREGEDTIPTGEYDGWVELIARVGPASCSLGVVHVFVNVVPVWLPPEVVTLAASATAGGSVAAPGEGSFDYYTGSSVLVVATPDVGYAFAGWTGTAVEAGRVANPAVAGMTVGMDGDYVLQANFVVLDTTPPVITSVSANPSVLWPANHKMVKVTVAVDAEDNSGQAPASRIVGVTSDEPINGPGDGNTQSDWVITGDLTVQLRAERSGSGGDRTYTIQVQCTDASGNKALGLVQVIVPHDQGKKK